MPKRSDIESILIIGAGPIVIGQACEFDYSGAQACKALRDEGYKVILVNSNPATIMTDPEMADVTYIEPITWEVLERIIEKEQDLEMLNEPVKGRYQEYIQSIKKDGMTPFDKKKTVKRLQREMKKAAEDMNFEAAIMLRDKVKDLTG